MLRRIVLVVLVLTLFASPALALELRGRPHSRLGSGLAWTHEGRLAVSAPGDESVLLVDPIELPPESTVGDTPLIVLRVPELDPTGQLAGLHLHDESLLAVLRAPAHGEAVIDLLQLRDLSEERDYAEQVAASLWIDDLPTFCGGEGEPPCLILRSAPDLDGDGLPDLALGRPDLGQQIFVSLPPLDGQTHDALLLEIDAVEATDEELRLHDPVYAESAAARAIGLPHAHDGAGVGRGEPMSSADGPTDEEYPDHHPVGDPNAPTTFDFDPIANVLGLSDWELASANPGATTVTSLPTSSSATHTLDGDSVAELLGAAAGTEIVIDGRFKHSVPLDVPFGRGAVAPALAITYAGGRFDPWLAHHWTLSGFPQIERHGPRGGAPTGDDALDTFRADGQLLIKEPLQSGSVRSFRTEQATPRWYSFDSSTDLWTVTGGGVTVTVGADGPHGAVEVGPSTSGLEVAHRWWIASEADDVAMTWCSSTTLATRATSCGRCASPGERATSGRQPRAPARGTATLRWTSSGTGLAWAMFGPPPAGSQWTGMRCRPSTSLGARIPRLSRCSVCAPGSSPTPSFCLRIGPPSSPSASAVRPMRSIPAA